MIWLQIYFFLPIFKSSNHRVCQYQYIYQEDRHGGLSIILAALLHQSVVHTVSLNFPSFVLLNKVLVLLDQVAVAVISLGSTSLRLKSTSFILPCIYNNNLHCRREQLKFKFCCESLNRKRKCFPANTSLTILAIADCVDDRFVEEETEKNVKGMKGLINNKQ